MHTSGKFIATSLMVFVDKDGLHSLTSLFFIIIFLS